MAASNSDDSCTAPENFHITTSEDNDDSHWTGQMIKCNLCNFSRKSFHCRDCLRIGNFIHTTERLSTSEKFSEKQEKYRHLQTLHQEINSCCQLKLNKHRLVELIKLNIKRKHENIAIIKQLIEEHRVSLKQNIIYKEMLMKNNRDCKKKLPQYDNNVSCVCKYVKKRHDEIYKMETDLGKLHQEMKYRIRHNIKMLIKYIFPISENIAKSIGSGQADGGGGGGGGGGGVGGGNITSKSLETVNALADATRTKYIRGRWELQDSELQHVIVGPSLPDNGDYSAYNEWVATNKDGLPTNTVTGTGGTGELLACNNHAYRISAALTYTTQLVHLLSFFLDVRLPYKTVYGDFCKKELTEQSFNRKVSRLNANILYLCYTQRVLLQSLKPTHTLANIQRLLDTGISDLGRTGAVDFTNNQFGSSNFQFFQDCSGPGEDSDESDDENSFPNEWEAIPHLSNLQDFQPPNLQNPQQTISTAGALLVNNAFASVTSIWRGFTGR